MGNKFGHIDVLCYQQEMDQHSTMLSHQLKSTTLSDYLLHLFIAASAGQPAWYINWNHGILLACLTVIQPFTSCKVSLAAISLTKCNKLFP